MNNTDYEIKELLSELRSAHSNEIIVSCGVNYGYGETRILQQSTITKLKLKLFDDYFTIYQGSFRIRNFIIQLEFEKICTIKHTKIIQSDGVKHDFYICYGSGSDTLTYHIQFLPTIISNLSAVS